MDQQQVDVGDAQVCEALFDGALQIARRKLGVRDLGRDEDLLALHARGVQPLSDLLLIAVDQRAVEVPIAELQRLLGDARPDAPIELPGAEPQHRNFRAIGFHSLHDALTRPTSAPAAD